MPRRKTEGAAPTAHKNTVIMECTIRLPSGTDTSWYDRAAPEEAAEALKLGATLYSTVKALKAGEAVAALESKQAAELAAVRANAEERVAAVAAELESATAAAAAAQQRAQALYETQRTEWITASAAEKDRLAVNHATRLQEMQAEIQSATARAAALEERRKVLEAGRDADVRAAEDRTKALLQHALDEKERNIARGDATLATLKAAQEAQAEELRALADLIRKKPSASSSVKGKDYENAFRERLIATFGLGDRFSLTDSNRIGVGHAGDSLMTWGEHTIMWEVKNYDRAVPTAEVEKFRRDVKENPQVRVGVMISRSTAITGKTASGDRTVEFVEGKMLIYLSNFEAMSEDTLPNLLLLFRVFWAHDHADAEEEEAEAKAAAIRSIEKLLEEASRAKTEWRLHKSHMENAMRWIAERVEDTESRIRGALALLQGTAKVVAVPAGVFAEPGGDTRLAADIQTILQHTQVEPTASCALNDLADAFAKSRNMTRDTAKTHIRAALQSTAIDARLGRPTRVLGLRLLHGGGA